MFKLITNKDDYIKACDVQKLPISYDGKIKKTLNWHDVLLENNPWLWHCHIKTTNVCNAKCAFCVEQNSKCKENAEHVVKNTDLMLREMEREGILFSVSLTGGEPLLFKRLPELCEVLKKHDIKFLTMNTNGRYLAKNINLIDGFFDFVNVSRHSISDEENNEIFRAEMPTIEELKEVKQSLKKTKLRIQCVLDRIYTIDDFLEFLDTFSFADDISFRRKMELGSEYGVSYDTGTDFYNRVLQYAFDNFEFKEQSIQDYYVYEIYRRNGKDITFSYSDMKMLRDIEQKEDCRVVREFIIHPNGIVAGSWNPNEKTILY